VRANVAETSRWAAPGTTGAGATIARARGAIIGAPDCDREHLIPDPKPPSRPGAFTMPTRGAHARGTVASWLGISGLPGSAVPELVWDA
jgi:hypothetical protein